MRAVIMPQENHIRIDDDPVTVAAGLMPEAPELAGFAVDANRPIHVITFDGAVGTIQRKSRVPGREDIEHFIGVEPLKTYAAVFTAEKARLAEIKRKQAEEQEALAQHVLDVAAAHEAEARAKVKKKPAGSEAEG